MTKSDHAASSDRDPLTLERLEAAATRYETPCANGSVVWHSWGSGPPLLLLHGAHGFWGHWARNIETLSQRYTLWVPDLPGMGESADPEGEDYKALTPPVAEGLRLLGIGRVDIVGFSYGGVFATYLAAYYPELCKSLTVLDPGGVDTPLGEMDLMSMKGLDQEQRREVSRHNLLQMMLRNPESVDELALAIQERGARGHRFIPAELIMPDYLVQVLPQVKAPFGAIWGDSDIPHPDPASQEAALRKYRPDLVFRVIENAGHWVMYEQADAFNATLLEVLDELNR